MSDRVLVELKRLRVFSSGDQLRGFAVIHESDGSRHAEVPFDAGSATYMAALNELEQTGHKFTLAPGFFEMDTRQQDDELFTNAISAAIDAKDGRTKPGSAEES